MSGAVQKASVSGGARIEMAKAISVQSMAGKGPAGFRLGAELKDYAALRERLREVLVLGRQRVEKELVLLRYHTGLLINEHVRLNQNRAIYGTQAVLNLEKDLGIDHTELQRYAQFARAYPIVGGRRQLAFNLPWIYYRKLLVVKDDARRLTLTMQAEKNEWSFVKIGAKVQHVLDRENAQGGRSRLPEPALGPYFTYKIIALPDNHAPSQELLLDMGFKHRIEIKILQAVRGAQLPARLEEGMIVTAEQGLFSIVKAEGAGEESLYTYRARIESIVDGDTLKVDLLFGLGNRKGETFRLNHIDCPEMDTPEGKAAKRFVENELADCEFITIKSVKTRREKWGRYLGDVLYEKKGCPGLVYLNQRLLDKGHAIRVRD